MADKMYESVYNNSGLSNYAMTGGGSAQTAELLNMDKCALGKKKGKKRRLNLKFDG